MLSNPYRLHAAIAGSFSPTQETQPEGRVLWRVDQNGDGPTFLYIVSPARPSLVGLDEQIGWPDLPQQWKTRDYDAYLDKIDVGQRFAFRLVANPVISRRSLANTHGRSKRIPHLTVLQQAAWLIGEDAYRGAGIDAPREAVPHEMSRAARCGFRVLEDTATRVPLLVVSDSRKLEFRKGQEKARIVLATARFDGVMEVINADLLRHALTHGIGHGKGFGCGLMTLAPSE